MDLRLTDRVYVVTGGSTGLGFASAQALVEEGARVVVVSRSRAAVDRAVDALGGSARGLAADLADPGTPAAALDLALDSFGRIDGALISVGGPPAGTAMTTTDEQWRSAFDSVFLGTIRMARAVCGSIRDLADRTVRSVPVGVEPGEQAGAIGLVLSTSAVEVFSGLATSNGLRPGLAMFVTDLADEVAADGIRVVGLLPGRIATERMSRLDSAGGDPSRARAAACAQIPLGRYGEPAEFGRVAAFLLSPAASYVTGTVLAVDGGATRHP